MTLSELIEAYKSDPISTYHKLRYNVRVGYRKTLQQITSRYGDTQLKDIRARTIILWHEQWLDETKFYAAHSFIKKLRVVIGYGLLMLEDPECQRLRIILHSLRFPSGKPRTERITAEHAIRVCEEAHRIGWHSIALAQAFQFELMLRQKDVIGEWVPIEEKGYSEIYHNGKKWFRGIQWGEVDKNIILRHVTSKRQKLIEIDLTLAPLVVDELLRLKRIPWSGPIIICEYNNRPYASDEFRRKWRIVADKAKVPRNVFNMDTRAGAITEATESGAALEYIKHAATHSNVSQTEDYSRGATTKIADVMRKRSSHRYGSPNPS